MRLVRGAGFAGLFAMLAVGLTACPGGGEATVYPLEVVEFSVSPETVIVGDPITVSWQVTNATQTTITYGDGQSLDLAGLNAGAGSVEVTIADGGDYTFTLTSTGVDGSEPAEVTSTATVTVENPDPPTIDSFTAEPAAVAPGDATTLAWAITAADSFTLTDDAGNELDVSGTTAEAGSLEVTPSADTTYTLAATNRGGTTTAEVTVTVYPLPTVDSFETDKALYTPGEDAVLSWTTTNATSVNIQDADGNVVVENGQPSDSFTVNPTVTTTYTLAATGDGGTTSADATVAIVPVIGAFSVEPVVVRAGDDVTLTWATEGATAVDITGPDGFTFSAAADAIASGSTTTTVSSPGDFVLTAASGDLSTDDTVSVTLTNAPRIRSLTVDPAAVTAGETTTVTWTIDGIDTTAGDTVTLTVDGTDADLSGLADVSAGSIDVQLDTAPEATITLTAENGSGADTATANVTVYQVPAIDAFTAVPTRVPSGGTVTFSWSTSSSDSVRITKDGVDMTGVNAGDVIGSATDQLTADATYILYAANVLGYEVASEPITVTVGDPVIADFSASATSTAPGDTVTLSWQVEGGTTLTLSDGSADLHSATDYAEISSGTFDVILPDTPGDYDYTLTVVDDASGTATSTITISVTDGPVIRTFESDAYTVTSGDSITLTWAVDNDAYGATPTLALDADGGQTYDISALDPNADSFGLTIDAPDGTTAAGATLTFTLGATTDGTAAASAQVTITVYPAPVIDSLVLSPESFDTQGGTVTPSSDLSWATHDAVSAELFELDSTGAQTSYYVAADQAEIDAHTLTITPSTTTTYRLIVTNEAGATATQDATFIIDGAHILTFEGTDADGNTGSSIQIVSGETATLSWTTERADSVALNPTEPLVTAAPTAYTDISNSPTATDITPTSNLDGGQTAVTFPAGFVFPYYGVDRTEMVVNVNGWLSFDPNVSNDHFPNPIPSAGNPDAVLAAFWDDLDGDNADVGLWWDTGSDADGQYLVVEWAHWNIYYETNDLNFQIVLHENGTIEYRYGTMTGTGADGADAGIGLEDDAGTTGFAISQETPVSGGLADTGWLISFPTPDLNGSMDVAPRTTTDYVLSATNTQYTDTDTVTIEVLPAASVEATASADPQIQAQRPFDISWTSQDATEVRVIKDKGGANEAVVCTVTDPDLVAEGSCTAQEDAAGQYTYTVEATGTLARDVASVDVLVDVKSLLEIASFTADGTADELFVDSATTPEVTLDWSLIGATEIYLEDAAGTDLTPADFAVQSLVVQVPETTTFTLHATDDASWTRERIATVTVYVDAASLDLTPSATTIVAGQSVTLDWTSTNASEGVTFSPRSTITTTGNDFSGVSIAANPAAQDVTPSLADDTMVSVDLSGQFNFTFDGGSYSKFGISTNGWISINDTYSSSAAGNDAIPDSGTPNGLLAPYWDDLNGSSGGTLVYLIAGPPGNRTLTIEWNGFQRYGRAGTMTFQAVLHSTGDVEYRYIEMTATDPADDSYYHGGSATVGWENMAGDGGEELLYNTTDTSVVDAGISHFFPLSPMQPNGSVTVTPDATTTYEACATGGGFTECQQVTINVVHPGDLMISEFLPNPDGTDTGKEWFEVYNSSSEDIDVAGWTLSDDGSDSITLGNGVDPVIVPAGSYFVFAQSSDVAVNGGIDNVGYAYGTSGFTLGNSGDEIVLSLGGTEIDRVNYTGSWPYASGQTASADPRVLHGNPVANDNVAFWTASVDAYGDATNLGTPGAAGPQATPTGTPFSVSDATVTTVSPQTEYDAFVTVPQACTVAGVSVDVDVSHGAGADYWILGLLAPDGQILVLFYDPNASGYDIVGNFPADYTPVESLDTLLGIEGQGDWALLIFNDAYSTDGDYNAWTLNLECL